MGELGWKRDQELLSSGYSKLNQMVSLTSTTLILASDDICTRKTSSTSQSLSFSEETQVARCLEIHVHWPRQCVTHFQFYLWLGRRF